MFLRDAMMPVVLVLFRIVASVVAHGRMWVITPALFLVDQIAKTVNQLSANRRSDRMEPSTWIVDARPFGGAPADVRIAGAG
ncbi:MAG: hypothetical protein CBHOC_3078 [uncultured Caballeronia sp.]|nr:MAG: hypothetical protein CBHOC_3078 [uncultured Caballeronia sp.]